MHLCCTRFDNLYTVFYYFNVRTLRLLPITSISSYCLHFDALGMNLTILACFCMQPMKRLEHYTGPWSVFILAY